MAAAVRCAPPVADRDIAAGVEIDDARAGCAVEDAAEAEAAAVVVIGTLNAILALAMLSRARIRSSG